MRGAWIRVFRHLKNTQNSQNFERAFQVQENGGTQQPSVLFIDVIVNKYFRINLQQEEQ